MSDIVLSATVEVPCPAGELWRIVSDYEQDPLWRAGVRSMAPSPAGPIAAGVTTAEVIRVGGQTYRNEGLVTAVGPGLTFAWRTTQGADANGARTVVPTGPRECRVRLDLHIKPHGVQRMLAPILRPILRRNLEGDVRRLRLRAMGTVRV